MQGIEISRRYYEKYGREMIHNLFPEYESRIAAGIAGEGSDCFGFDDEISRDHDFGAGFRLWVDDETYDEIGFKLTRAYTALPDEIDGIKAFKIRPYGTDRFGVIKISDFFLPLTGSPGAPESLIQWATLPDYSLAAAVNGEIFRDDSGIVTGIRESILDMPEDVKLKKISARAIAMAQSGQYNYRRCIEHGERGAAALAKAEFVKNAAALCHNLGGRYCPFYKWAFRSLQTLEKFAFLHDDLVSLAVREADEKCFDEIERISGIFADYFRENGLSQVGDNFLEPHAYEIQNKISDPALRNMHIMEG